MKKLITSIGIVGVVAAIAIGATVAYFSDTETSTGNTFTAGTLDLKVDGKDDTEVVHIVLDNIKPGWSGEYRWTIKNAGSLDGTLWFEIKNLVNNENGLEEPEKEAPGENRGEPGELGDKMIIGKINFYDPNSCQGASRPRKGSPSGSECPHWMISLNTWAQDRWYYQDILKSGQSKDLDIIFSLPSDVGNCVQGDSVSFDIVFHLDQVTP
jgi:predicted ribosomally synthesized peptide with SipW-like signal peptide